MADSLFGERLDLFSTAVRELPQVPQLLTGLLAAARDWVAVRGYDKKMGARPMARVIQEHIKRPLAEELLFGKLAEGGHVRVEVAHDGQSLLLTIEPLKRELEDLREKGGQRALAGHKGDREE